MIKSILTLLGSTLSIWENKEAKKYLELMYKLEKEYDDENDKDKPDHNVLDTTSRSIMRVSNLVSFEINRSKINS